jgi:hypothetical protein
MDIRDPFRYIPPSQLPEMADKLGRNEIVTSNEFRSVLGMRPSDDPKADELRNKNLNEKADPSISSPEEVKTNQNGRSSEKDATS